MLKILRQQGISVFVSQFDFMKSKCYVSLLEVTMASNVIPLHHRQLVLAGYLRVGHDRHRLLEHMLMIDHHDEHFIIQRSKQLAGLAKTPADKRVDAFLVDYLGTAVRKARASTLLKIDDVALKKALVENRKRLTRLEEAVVTLDKLELSRSMIPEFRGGTERLNVVLAS